LAAVRFKEKKEEGRKRIIDIFKIKGRVGDNAGMQMQGKSSQSSSV